MSGFVCGVYYYQRLDEHPWSGLQPEAMLISEGWPLPSPGHCGKAGPKDVGEMGLPLTSCSSQESGPCALPGQHSKAVPGFGS